MPTNDLLNRIDHLARLGTATVELSGGEPMLYPDLDVIIHRIRQQGMLAGLITNGYLLNVRRIQALNDAGLDHLQLSIDNVTPDETSKKSLKVLDQKLQMLAKHAEFSVNINSVLGGSLANPEDARVVARRAVELGLTATLGLIHDGDGHLIGLSPQQRAVYDDIAAMTAPFYSVQNQNAFQRNLVAGKPNTWHCGAGARYLYICEDGLVHWCSQQRGYPGIPLERHTTADLERELHTEKSCALLCTVSCVHRMALLDRLRSKPMETLDEMLPPDDGTARHAPWSVRLLRSMFVTSPYRHWFRAAAGKLLGA